MEVITLIGVLIAVLLAAAGLWFAWYAWSHKKWMGLPFMPWEDRFPEGSYSNQEQSHRTQYDGDAEKKPTDYNHLRYLIRIYKQTFPS